jgi:hypothetical protein
MESNNKFLSCSQQVLVTADRPHGRTAAGTRDVTAKETEKLMMVFCCVSSPHQQGCHYSTWWCKHYFLVVFSSMAAVVQVRVICSVRAIIRGCWTTTQVIWVTCLYSHRCKTNIHQLEAPMIGAKTTTTTTSCVIHAPSSYCSPLNICITFTIRLDCAAL